MVRAESSKDAESNGTKAQSNGTEGSYELPWVEKYRPTFLDDIVGNTETIDRLKIIAKDGNMPHLIISGMPGIGKTTSILCLARQLLGDAYKEAVLELNASDERGIDVVRNRIKGFAQKKVTLPAGRQKIVILDEADSMTSGAQQALRRTMEIYSGTTRFAFACNQSNKIIEPLQSRCAILRYSRLTDGQVVKRLYQICKAENVEYGDDGIAALVFSAEGDMRQAINNLQSTSAGFGFVSGDNVFKVVDSPHPIKVQAMIKSCQEQKIDEALDSLKELWNLGYSSHDIISTMFRVTKTLDSLSEHSKLEFIRIIGFTHMRILEGLQTYLQLAGCVAKLCKLNMKPSLFVAPKG
ncbi:hypothetical protein AMS68_007976 [Peltaster fructicola]|uniref:AAA+ ATPase domain-containing protein n=1 Tax=Peltaster fructicola TaxID=286661 RepID=A0A6H0Y6K6_9PEZI|nr:hypothetical protein AMS68_007976 [Peltaster fructicola]